MKSKKKLKRALKILEREQEGICFEMRQEYNVVRRRLIDCYQTRRAFKRAVKRTRIKKKFKKALAVKLGVEYALIKDHIPVGLNSTMIANCLDPLLFHLRHGEIRGLCQELKVEFDDRL